MTTTATFDRYVILCRKLLYTLDATENEINEWSELRARMTPDQRTLALRLAQRSNN